MANKRPPLTFSELDKPKGKGAILRTPEEIAAENELFDVDADTQEIQESSSEDFNISGNQELWKNKKELDKAALRASYPKGTYRLSPEALEAIEDIKRLIRRQYKGKILLEEVVEEAVIAAYHDL